MSILATNGGKSNTLAERNEDMAKIKELAGLSVTDEKVAEKIRAERKEDYCLQSKGQWLLKNNGYDNNVTSCRRKPVGVPYLAKSKNGRVSYGNIATCSNVWLCRVCSKIINKRRALEIVKAVSWAYKNKYVVCMLTFTHPHAKGMPLAELKEKHMKALKYFKSGRRWKAIAENIGYQGCINSIEITHGFNGWHFHNHMLVIIKDMNKLKAVEGKLKEIWYKCLLWADIDIKNIDDVKEHGLDIQYQLHDTEYLTKFGMGNWGAEKEISSGAKKKGKGKSPWELLDGNQKEKELFMEYARAVSLGNKTSQIRWSKGLKKKVGVKNKTDKEISEEVEEGNELLGYLTIEEWKLILKYKARAEVLSIAERKGFLGVVAWFERKWVEEGKRNKVA